MATSVFRRFTPVDVVTASARSGWAPGIDLRLVADSARGLFLVGDGFGPTYGGHHFPLALEPCVNAICVALQEPYSCDLREAIQAGKRVAEDHTAKYEPRHAGASTGPPATEAEALMHAQVRAAPSGLFHCAVGTTVALLVGNTVHGAQVGMSRMYLSRAGDLRLLLRDHSLPSEYALLHGTESSEYRTLLEFHRTVVTRMLGVSAKAEADYVVEPLQPSDVVLLCSSGVWNCGNGDEIVRQLVDAPVEALDGLVQLATKESRHDAAMIRFRVEAAPLETRTLVPPYAI